LDVAQESYRIERENWKLAQTKIAQEETAEGSTNVRVIGARQCIP
jgi:hypothetical protein